GAWACPLPGQSCLACGNGSIESGALIGEECDDNNQISGDGCSATCQLEPGASCPAAGEPCTLCGDGIVTASAGEVCDDGNRYDRDGCSSTCQPETGWSCPAEGGACFNCGNGVREIGSDPDHPLEECDDRNNHSGDGCSATCQVEEGWNCSEPAGSSRSSCDTCGNGFKGP